MEQKFTKNDRVIQVGSLHKFTVQDVREKSSGVFEYTLIDGKNEITKTDGENYKTVQSVKLYTLQKDDYIFNKPITVTENFKTEEKALQAYNTEVQNLIDMFDKEGFTHKEVEHGVYEAFKLYGGNKRTIRIRVRSF